MFLINKLLFFPPRKSNVVSLLLVKEYNIETESATEPILYSSRSIRLQLFCYVSDNNQIYEMGKTFVILSVIKQKGKSQNRCYKKTKHAKFLRVRIKG